MNTISGIYKITNVITGDFYIGSSKNVKERWRSHKKPSTWNKCPNNPMYLDFQKYGIDKFAFELLAEVEIEQLKEKEQQFIELLKPTYNNYRANGLDIDRRKESNRKANRKYYKSDKHNEYKKQYQKEYQRKYDNQLCSYNGETLTLAALRNRFQRQGLSNPTQEAKKYLLGANND